MENKKRTSPSSTHHSVKLKAVAAQPMTVAQWLNTWLENYVRPGIRQSTYEVYRSRIDNHIIPGLGSIPLEELTATDIQLFFRNLEESGNCLREHICGLAPSTVVCIRNLLKMALEQASLEGKILRNPAKQTKPPKVEKREMNILCPEEVALFLHRSIHFRYYAAYVLTLTTGVRRGEVLGLPWRAVSLGMPWNALDLVLPWDDIGRLPLWDTDSLRKLLHKKRVHLRPDPFITISQQLSDLRSGPEITLPKTRRSLRVIGIPFDTALTLIFQRYLQNTEKQKMVNYNPDDLVFCNETGGYVSPRNFTRTYQRALQYSGVKKTRFHDLRHTVATVLLEDGRAINTVQEILGHYDPAFTASQYGHVTARMQREATETLGQALKNAKNLDV